MTQHDFKAALEDLDKLSTCPSIWQDKITAGCRKLLDNHYAAIRAALEAAIVAKEGGDE